MWRYNFTNLLNVIGIKTGSHIYAPGVLAMESNTHIDENVSIFTGNLGQLTKTHK